MQPLNYTTKAIKSLLSYPCPDTPGTKAGLEYLAGKLRQAEVFALHGGGDLLDRSKPRPQVPGVIFRPPFPVIAVEFPANGAEWGSSIYVASPCSRRIALAWEWADDMPDALRAWLPEINEPGVVVASIGYYDAHQSWMAIPAGLFMAYDGGYIDQQPSQFREVMLAEGRITPKLASAQSIAVQPIAFMPEALAAMAAQYGFDGALDFLRADMMDEANAYIDLCFTLACKNVRADRHHASKALNRSRIKSGKLPLKDFHILTIDGAAGGDGEGFAAARNGPRTHLRRGHIRRLDANRVTWVNATMVRGRGGFVDKAYAVGGHP